jgi:hypothetical protein
VIFFSRTNAKSLDAEECISCFNYGLFILLFLLLGLSLAVSLDKWVVCISAGCSGWNGDGETIRILSSTVERLPMATPLASHSFRTLCFARTVCENTHQSSGMHTLVSQVYFKEY